MGYLTLKQTKTLLERGILDINNTHITIYNCYDDFVIDKVYDLGNNIRFIATRIKYEEPRNISYKEISSIGGMNIDDIINAYMFDEEDDILEINSETNIVKDIIGKTEATLEGHKLENGMKVILHNDVTKKYNDKILIVKYDEENGFKLSGKRGRPKKSS